jgi:energy-coupling factor transport system permease protein
MDALSKFLWLFIISSIPFVMWEWWQVAIEVAILFLLSVSLSKMSMGNVLRSWALFVGLGGLIMFFHVTNRHEGELVAKIWFIAVHTDGIRAGLIFAFRVVAIMASSYIFVRTTSPRDLVVGMISLGLNYRYTWMLFVAMLSLPVFEAEIGVIKEAQMVRGIKPASNPISERIQMYRRYMMPMLASALRRVENLAVAMDSRAFGAFPDRTFIDDFSWSLSGIALLILTLVAFFALLAWRITVKPGIYRF